ncbi:hypothetical protein GCM10011529_28350 [Polymorphobacter glacialis]|uniref:Uncharacterized protein n=1 Tax=Sandarakinorhabdus glacialis TaxID=1614636 RepID=A0A916ZZE7_9SPHN|nr:hypothetical protein [Polymorphobacter glacialis]GGE20063.1 hypothetical protein GCM10011529_28350 [Polymorphobacter glacialis]
MKFTNILFALWCLAVVALFALAVDRGYSPFAQGGGPGGRGGFFFFGGFGGGSSGPRHK